MIRSVKLYHQQVYEFSIHRGKLDLLIRRSESGATYFTPLADYLSEMMRICPHELFQTTQRASQAKTKARFDLHQVSVTEKQNFPTRDGLHIWSCRHLRPTSSGMRRFNDSCSPTIQYL